MSKLLIFLIGYAVGSFTVLFMFGMDTPDDDEYEKIYEKSGD